MYDMHFIVFTGLFLVRSFHCQITRLQQAVQYIKQNVTDAKLLTDLEVSTGKSCNCNHPPIRLR